MPPGSPPEQLAFGLWALTFGGYTIAATSPSIAKQGIQVAIEAITVNGNLLLDGFGWQPLSRDSDLPSLIERIGREVFADELSQIAAL